MYGSSLINDTLRPRASSKHPIEDAARPLPKLETTPPVTKIYLFITPFLYLRTWFWPIAFCLLLVEAAALEVFLRLYRFGCRRIQNLLQTNEARAQQTRLFGRPLFKFLDRDIVRFRKLPQTENRKQNNESDNG